MLTGSSRLDDTIETVARLSGRLGLNETRVRWKLIRATQRAEGFFHSLEQRLKHLLYPHKVCTKCGAILDRNAQTCVRCGERATSRSLQLPSRLGVVLPGLVTPTAALCALIVGIYTRLALGSGSVASLSVDVLYTHGGNYGPSVWAGEWWRLGSSIFLHANLPHILFNTVALAQVGRHVEELFGKLRMLAFFLLTGVFASAASALWPRGVSIGASGAIMGLIGVTAGWGHRDGTTIGRNARDYMIRWGASCIMLGFFIGADNVAHAAGFLSGAILGYVIPPLWRARRASSPAAAFALLLSLVVAAVSVYPTWFPLSAETPWGHESVENATANTPTVDFSVRDAADQEVEIIARGPGILLFEDNARQVPPEDPDDVMPDVVELFVRAANLGMLGGRAYPPWESEARVLSKDVDVSEQCETWRIKLHHVDPGALRVLHDLLAARNLDRIAVFTVDAPRMSANPAAALALSDLQYPGPYPRLSFEVEAREEVSSVYVTFASQPEQERVKALDADLETWLFILWLGGYGGFGGIPNGASPPDDSSVGVSFDEFESDPAAVHAVVNYAERVHHGGIAVRKVTIR